MDNGRSRTSDLELAACAISTGCKLRQAIRQNDGRVLFEFDALPDDFGVRWANRELMVNAHDFVVAWKTLKTMTYGRF